MQCQGCNVCDTLLLELYLKCYGLPEFCYLTIITVDCFESPSHITADWLAQLVCVGQPCRKS